MTRQYQVAQKTTSGFYFFPYIFPLNFDSRISLGLALFETDRNNFWMVADEMSENGVWYDYYVEMRLENWN